MQRSYGIESTDEELTTLLSYLAGLATGIGLELVLLRLEAML